MRTYFQTARSWLRRGFGLAYSAVQRDSLNTLRVETEQLGSAAVESSAYVGAELRAIGERLTRLENELAAVRRLLEERSAVGGPSD
jgi:hypothetical protein